MANAYIKTLPGLEEKAPAHGRPAHLPVREVIWLDGCGEISWLDSSMDVAALK